MRKENAMRAAMTAARSAYEQCLAAVSGAGGYCEPNTMYVPPSGTGKTLLARHHRHRVYR